MPKPPTHSTTPSTAQSRGFCGRGHDGDDAQASRQRKLDTGRAAITVCGTSQYEGVTLMMAYKADLDEQRGFMFVAANEPDYEPGSPDEQPFVYCTGLGKDLDDAAKARLLQDLHDTFRSPAE